MRFGDGEVVISYEIYIWEQLFMLRWRGCMSTSSPSKLFPFRDGLPWSQQYSCKCALRGYNSTGSRYRMPRGCAELEREQTILDIPVKLEHSQKLG
jgi:hypothetical protein